MATSRVLLWCAFTLRYAFDGRSLRSAIRLYLDTSTRWRHLLRHARSMQRESQPVGLCGADGVRVEQRPLHHRRQCLLRQSDPWHLPRPAGMRLGKRQRILFGHPRRLLGQQHQHHLLGGRLFVVRHCRVHGNRSFVLGVRGHQSMRGDERVLLEAAHGVLRWRADSLQSALRRRLCQPSRVYPQHAVAEGPTASSGTHRATVATSGQATGAAACCGRRVPKLDRVVSESLSPCLKLPHGSRS